MNSSARSMTGFARARAVTPRGELVVSLRGVNHRGLDLHFHLGAEFEPFEPALRKLISARVFRGHLDIRIQLQPARSADAAAFNRPLLEAWLSAFRQAAVEFALTAEPDLNAAFRIPGMLSSSGPSEELGPETEAAVLDLMGQALDQFNAHREQEGAETIAVLQIHAAAIRDGASAIESLREGIVPILQARMQERIGELLGATTIDPTRLVQETAILADRSDIGEEVTRLKIHSARLAELLEGGGELGKKLDFLLQEMQRETNTILSKSTGASEPGRQIAEIALAVKSEVEKIREQALNLE